MNSIFFCKLVHYKLLLRIYIYLVYFLFPRLCLTHKHVKARNRHNAHRWMNLFTLFCNLNLLLGRRAVCEFCNCFERAKRKHTHVVFSPEFSFCQLFFLSLLIVLHRSLLRGVSVSRAKAREMSSFLANFFASSFACLLNLFPQQLRKC